MAIYQSNRMTNKTLAADVKLMKRFKTSPIFFIEKMWGLTPQPLKPETKDFVEECVFEGALMKIRPEHFEPFVKGKHITWQQWLTLTAVELAVAGMAPRRISVVSGHGTGKSGSMAWLLLWFLFCHKNAQIPCTAPTSNQMHDILWKEVSLWLKRMPEWAQAMYEWQSEYVRIIESPATWFARAKTASKENSEALAGVHGDHVLGLVDEASGVYDDIFHTAEGALTGPNVLLLMISNGTRLTGYFFNSHNKDAHNWQTLRFNSEESPIVDRAFVNRIAELHGKDSDEYSIRVLGGFGKQEGVDDQGYVPLLTEANLRKASLRTLKGQIKLGIDPAGDGGDEMAQIGRDLFIAKVLTCEKVSTTKSIASAAVTHIKGLSIAGDNVAVDNFGVGANVAQEIALADKESPIRVQAINVGDVAEDRERFVNRRAELAWKMREWLIAGGEIVDLDAGTFKEELLSLRYRRATDAKGRIQLMDKRTMKKLNLNHGRSPNKADALMLTFNRPDDEVKEYKQEEWESTSEFGG